MLAVFTSRPVICQASALQGLSRSWIIILLIPWKSVPTHFSLIPVCVFLFCKGPFLYFWVCVDAVAEYKQLNYRMSCVFMMLILNYKV